MSDPIVDYLEWKKQGGELRSRAKHAIETRFRELLTEAAQLAEAYKEDFGATLAPPSVVTVFKFKTGGKKVPAKKVVAAAPAAVVKAAAPVKVDPKIVALEKQLAGARKKLDAAKEKGGPTKNLEDRVYELEDDLRLATQSV
jgi:hypothetical protein